MTERLTPRWDRVVLKVSGEAFAGTDGYGIDGEVVGQIAQEIVEVCSEFKVDVAVVVGGGNIWRGMSGAGAGMDRAQADYMGMLATTINALALQDTLEQLGQPTRVQTAIRMEQIAEPYIRRRATRHLEKGRVVIFAGGTGNPFFTTDTAAALRAVEIEAGVVLKGTHSGTDGIYTADPRLDPEATLLEQVSHLDVIQMGLRAMDATAVTLCMENDLPIVMFDLMTPGNVRSILAGESVGTLVAGAGRVFERRHGRAGGRRDDGEDGRRGRPHTARVLPDPDRPSLVLDGREPDRLGLRRRDADAGNRHLQRARTPPTHDHAT